MARSRRIRTLCSGLLALAGLLWPPSTLAGGQILHEDDLETESLEIELYSAEVKIYFETSAAGYLQVTAPDETTRVRAPVDWQAQGAHGVLRRLPIPETSSGDATRPQDLTVDLILPPETRIKLSGQDLRVTIERVDPEPVDDFGESAAGLELDEDTTSARPNPLSMPQPVEPLEHALEIDVEGSSVDLWGLGQLSLTARQSEVRLEGIHGTAHLDLYDSSGEIQSHHGDLRLTGEGSNLDLLAADGGVQIQWVSGDLVIQEGSGPLGGQVRNALVRIERRHGPVTLKGANSTLSCRESQDPSGAFDLQGEDLVVVLDDWKGGVAARLIRGSLRGNGWRGKGNLSLAGGASLDVRDLRGEYSLRIQSDSEGRIGEVLGQLKAVVQQSSLQIEEVERLDLSARDAQVTVSGIERLLKFSASQSTLDLDFSATRDRRPKIELLGENEVEVLLASPCIVELTSGRAVDDSGIDISGCELMRQGTGRRRNAPLRVDGQPMTHLLVTTSPETSLRVEGR